MFQRQHDNDRATLPPAATDAPARRTLARALRSPVLAYPIAAVVVWVAALLTIALWQPLLSRNPCALFYAAVVLVAWYAGAGPGLGAAALAVWLVHTLLTPSFVPWGTDGLLQLSVFASIALLIASLNGRRRAVEAQLVAAKESADRSRAQAEAASAAKDQFLAVLSHELRTPLTPALALTSCLEHDPRVPPDARASLEVVRRNVELEARLIDDLLDLTRIAHGKIQFTPAVVEFAPILSHVMDVCRPDALDKQLTLSCAAPGRAARVNADAARLQQILWNLVKNAVKFTPPGGRVAVTAVLDESTHSIVTHVRDTGIGIPRDVLPRLFNAFEQGDTTTTRRFGGLGLGLAISKALAELHGGTLTAASDGPDSGATFTLRLPLTTDPLPVPAAAPPLDPRSEIEDPQSAPPSSILHPPTSACPARPRLLLVEDHEDTARAMARLLRAAAYDVRTANSVESALSTAATEPFDLVVSDLGLPDGSGLDLMVELRQRYNLSGIALSGFGMEEDIARSHQAGFSLHLTKPVNFHDLHSAIRQVVG